MTTENLNLESTLSAHITAVVENHLSNLNGSEPNKLYELFLGEFEKAFLTAILKHTKGNQSKAAIMLGLNRGTLRTKLKNYGLLKK